MQPLCQLNVVPSIRLLQAEHRHKVQKAGPSQLELDVCTTRGKLAYARLPHRGACIQDVTSRKPAGTRRLSPLSSGCAISLWHCSSLCYTRLDGSLKAEHGHAQVTSSSQGRVVFTPGIVVLKRLHISARAMWDAGDRLEMQQGIRHQASWLCAIVLEAISVMQGSCRGFSSQTRIYQHHHGRASKMLR